MVAADSLPPNQSDNQSRQQGQGENGVNDGNQIPTNASIADWPKQNCAVAGGRIQQTMADIRQQTTEPDC
jgi:hypothetical protein